MKSASRWYSNLPDGMHDDADKSIQSRIKIQFSFDYIKVKSLLAGTVFYLYFTIFIFFL